MLGCSGSHSSEAEAVRSLISRLAYFNVESSCMAMATQQNKNE